MGYHYILEVFPYSKMRTEDKNVKIEIFITLLFKKKGGLLPPRAFDSNRIY